MKRTNLRIRFFTDNRRLLLLLVFLFVGCIGGVVLYHSLKGELLERANTLLPLRGITGGIRGGFSQLCSSCFQTLCLLAVLFIAGLSACGAPIAFTIPLFWGAGLGMTQAYYYASGGAGVLLTALLVLPHSLPEAAALLMGCAESLRMSMQITGQLLPRGAHCGGLWQDFRLYSVRFLLLLPLLLAAGALDVGLRALFLRFFPAALWVA
ncbi:MAG: stage II sporulation protein M [Clostridia bacterium]|nr:stage II sporulation protein M [Clostridia bacterium]